MADIKDGGALERLKDFFTEQVERKIERDMMMAEAQRAAMEEYAPSAGQLANFGGMILPMSGIADAAGEYPTLPSYDQPLGEAFSGEAYPSMAENIERGGFGGYTDAFLQSLGVAGDALYATPLIGPVLGGTVGTLLKTTGAAGKIAKAALTAERVGSSSKKGITALKNNFIDNHPPIGSLDAATNKPVTEQLIRTRANAYEKQLNNGPPAVRRRETLRAAGDIERLPGAERTIKTPEDLLGKVLVPVVGDRSVRAAKGSNRPGYVDIKGVPLSRAVLPQGGPSYTIDNIGTGKAWASMEDAANKKQMNIILAGERTGMDPIGVYSAMGRESIDFSAPVASAMVAQIPALGIPKKILKEFDQAIKKGVGKVDGRPDFVGLGSDDVFNQLLGHGDFPAKGAGALRKVVVEEMKKARWRNLGFPVYDDIVDTLTEPALAGFKSGESGYTMFRGDPTRSTFPEPLHQSYDTAIPGDYFGGLIESVPPEIMYPKTFKEMSQTANKAGVLLPYEQQVGSLMMNPKLYEVADDQYVEGLINYMNKYKGTNYAMGGEVTGAGIGSLPRAAL
tara:strand:+ start:978 stop:2669 length:1692 start_codon:yes stop_codon:yes gene_type:complete